MDPMRDVVADLVKRVAELEKAAKKKDEKKS